MYKNYHSRTYIVKLPKKVRITKINKKLMENFRKLNIEVIVSIPLPL